VPGAKPLTFTADKPLRIEAIFGAPPVSVPDEVTAESPAPRPTPSARFVWRQIPAGSSWMGCVPGDTRCDTAELPRVPIRIAAPFEMMDREVSVADFRAFAAATSRQMPRQPEWYATNTHPVVNVMWDEAREYCEWGGGRLPSEEEWEFAARGGLDGRLFPWGDVFTGQAVARHEFPGEIYKFTAPAGALPPNGYGLHDMAGNVWEWTASEYRPSHATDPQSDRDLRTIKGGGWDNSARRLRVSERTALSRAGRHNLYVGFRCVRSAQS
jgi:formylglycine-generating enzyme required for sulfatase activity